MQDAFVEEAYYLHLSRQKCVKSIKSMFNEKAYKILQNGSAHSP